jgi:hypothetical protein
MQYLFKDPLMLCMMGRDGSVGIATRYGLDVRGSNPSGDEILRTRPDRSWGPPNFVCNGYRVSFPGLKRPGRSANHAPPSSAEVKERVELYMYFLSRPSWLLLGRTFNSVHERKLLLFVPPPPARSVPFPVVFFFLPSACSFSRLHVAKNEHARCIWTRRCF